MKLSSVALLLVLLFAGCGCFIVLINDGYFSQLRLPTAYENSIFVVDLTEVPAPVKLAGSISAGLLNKHFGRPAVFTLLQSTDINWSQDLRANSELASAPWQSLSPQDLLAYAIGVGAATGTVVYDPAEPWSLANVVTLCGIESAIPIPTHGLTSELPAERPQAETSEKQKDTDRVRLLRLWNSLSRNFRLRMRKEGFQQGDSAILQIANLPLLKDVSGIWRDDTDAGLYAWTHLLPLCKETDDTVVNQRPELLSQGFLADLIVSRNLFVFFLPGMCTDGPQQLLYRSIAERAYSQGNQLKVMGYNTVNEVVADCSIHHTEISLVSDWSPNLSFFSRMQSRREPYHQNSFTPAPAFNPNHTYLAIINSDGDNMQMENNGNRPQMEERVKICTTAGSICPPLAWTISNNLDTYAPFLLDWYYRQALNTKKDSFLMGPSGFGFLHPAAVAPDSPLLTKFVTSTVEAAQQLGMTSYVHWDIDGNDLTQAWMYPASDLSSSQEEDPRQNATLQKTLSEANLAVQQLKGAQRALYLMHYDGTQIDTIFAPGEYNIPSWSGNVAGIDEQYRWFKDTPIQNVVSITNSIPKGTVGYIYKIFDVSMNDLEDLARQVDSHVKLVDHRQMHDIALQKKMYFKSA